MTPDPIPLSRWMAQNVPGYIGPLTLTRLAGGQSNPTWRIATPGAAYVLRQKPIGATLPSAHAVDREFRVLRALAGTDVPVPHAIALCDDPAVMGSMFYVMDFVPGRVLFDPTLPDLSPADRGAVYTSMNQTIAAIHTIDPVTVGLGDYGRAGGYAERQIARWTKQYRAAETVPIPAMDALIDWLPRNRVESGETRLVHGDYRLDNLILDADAPRVIGVLDWELSTLGCPIADFAYHMMSWRIPPHLFRGLGGVDIAALGIPDEETYLAEWCARTNRPRPEGWEFYIILSLFRIASIVQGIARRAVDGSANDPDAVAIGAKAAPLAEIAWDMAKRT